MTQADLQSKFPKMTPVKSPPALFRYNGCGVALYGNRDFDAYSGTHVATWCLSLLFVPVLCLRAYRVSQSAGRRWYFLGREPLSATAKWWNASIIAGVLATLVVTQAESYTSRPQYQAKKQMAHATELAKQGHLAQSESEFKVLALHHSVEADHAVAAAEDLLKNKIDQAPLPEALGVLIAAAAIGHQGFPIPLSEVAEKGMQIVAARGDADPANAVQILDAIRPLQTDPRALDDRRLVLLKSWASSEPQNVDAVAPLAMMFSEKGDTAGARKLLMPVKDKLADGEGARVLGMILAREGNYDASYDLLWPYAKTRLEILHQAEHDFEATRSDLWDRQIELLKTGKAPDDFYAKYKAAEKGEKQNLVSDYVNSRLKDDPRYAAAQEKLVKAAAVVPVAMELGIVMLNQAQAQPDVQRRKAELQSAEQVFLAIGGVASESNTYRLSLGEVDYWLGKEAEGRNLFDQYLVSNGRNFNALLELALQYRQLGADVQARAMAEEGYSKATTSEEKNSAAGLRARCFKDLDDEITWLEKIDQPDAGTKANLCQTKGDKALLEGRDQDAIAMFQSAIDIYAAMPRTATSLNNGALAHYAVFRATGNRESLDRCIDFFQQAVDLDPRDSILIYNAASMILEGAIADVIGNAIDLRTLRSAGSFSMLAYLHRDQATRAQVVQKFKSHPGVQRAVSYFQKLMIIAPKNAGAYSSLYDVYNFTRDEDGLRSLEQRVKAAGLDVSEQPAEVKSLLSGEKDQQNVTQLTALLKKDQATMNEVRPRSDRTAAVAIDMSVTKMLALDEISGQQDADNAVALAQDAERIAPSSQTHQVLGASLLNRALKRLRKSDANFNRFAGKFIRQMRITQLIAVAASEATPYQSLILRDPDVQAAMQLTIDDLATYPESAAACDWAFLKASHPADAEKTARILRTVARFPLDASIQLSIDPYSLDTALNSYWLMQVEGSPMEAKAALRKIVDVGLPVPIQP